MTDTKSNVLLLGETGTGKELFARVIHHNSSRRDMPFVPINCSAIPENLLETELFGHVRGAFTGAVASKKGILEEAEGGTVFLDEIGDMSLALQAKLLRVIEDQVIRPVGGTKGNKVDIRFVTATNKDLRAAVKQGTFREDLYYRINVISLHIPPLRERKEDIRSLTQYYLDKYSFEMGREVKQVSPEAMDVMMRYEWAGNVRELQNVIERAILISDGSIIGAQHLPGGVRSNESFGEQVFERKAHYRGLHQGVYPEVPVGVQRAATRRNAGHYAEVALGETQEVGDTEGTMKTGVIQFPCAFPIKVMGLNTEAFSAAVVAIFRRHLPDAEISCTGRVSSGEKYLSLTVTITAESQEQLNAIYEDLNRHELVLMTL